MGAPVSYLAPARRSPLCLVAGCIPLALDPQTDGSCLVVCRRSGHRVSPALDAPGGVLRLAEPEQVTSKR
jgi:hypothetical protein